MHCMSPKRLAGCWVSQGPVPSTSLDAYEIDAIMIASFRDLSSSREQ